MSCELDLRLTAKYANAFYRLVCDLRRSLSGREFSMWSNVQCRLVMLNCNIVAKDAKEL